MCASYTGGEFTVTLSSKHRQSKFWPEFLPEDNRILFIIERSKNGNVVVYRFGLDGASGHLDHNNPFYGEWWTNGWTKNPYREDLGFFERKMAYGYSCAKEDEDNYTITLVALPQRKLRLYKLGNEFVAVLEINGVKCKLCKLFVNTTEGWGTPTVNYVDLYGFELDDPTKQQVERIKP
jgi:hypothetical protein